MKSQDAKKKADLSKKILRDLNSILGIDIELTSESEQVVKTLQQYYDEDLVDESRRTFKALMIASLAKSVFLPQDSLTERYEELQKLREQDGYEEYLKETKQLVRGIAQEYVPVNLYHNPYLRRAFREVVSPDEMRNATSSLYETKQSQIRTKLAKLVKDDFDQMGLKKDDFDFLPDVETIWPVIEYMSQGKELAGTTKNADFKDLLQSLKSSGANVGKKGVAFHHIVWKKAFNSIFEEKAALNPANLIALNDTRHGEGDHDLLHQAGSYPSRHKLGSGGGKFSDMDPVIIEQISDIHLKERVKKHYLYEDIIKSSLEHRAEAKKSGVDSDWRSELDIGRIMLSGDGDRKPSAKAENKEFKKLVEEANKSKNMAQPKGGGGIK